MTTTKLYAVRAIFDDPAGATTHEDLYGTEPTVFRTREQANYKRHELTTAAATLDWESLPTPRYYVEVIDESELWPAERIHEDQIA